MMKINDVKLDEYRQGRKQYQIAEKLAKNINNDYFDMTYAENPEYILLETERQNNISNLAYNLKKSLGKKEYEYLKVYADTNMNYSETARRFGVDHKNAMYWIKKAQLKAQKVIRDNGLTVDDFYEMIKPVANNHSNDNATKVGYPFETYMHLPAQGSWDGKYGSQRSTTKKTVKCSIPEYLEFYNMKCDSCPICIENYKCTRTDKFVQNKKPTDVINKNRQVIIECINNIQDWMQGQDFSDLERYERL